MNTAIDSKKAFLFDLDGVIIDSEPLWAIKKDQLLPDLFGADAVSKLGPTSGVSLEGIFKRGKEAGANVEYRHFLDAFQNAAIEVYSSSPLNADLDKLVNYLDIEGYFIGIVSASPMSWITTTIERLKFQRSFDYIVGLHDVDNIRQKPYPDGYIEAMRRLHVTPDKTVILEDSETGIESAKASGALTIALPRADEANAAIASNAEFTARRLLDVINILESRKKKFDRPIRPKK